MVTMYAVVFTDDNEETTEHSAHLTEEAAVHAGGELARAKWAVKGPRGVPFPDHDNDWDAMDALRCSYGVRLEVEPIEVSGATIRALHAALTRGRKA